MQKKLTLSIGEELYNDLHLIIGRRKISKFIENIVKPYLNKDDLKLAYEEMSRDKQREKEAYEWEEGLIENDFSKKKRGMVG